MENLALSDKCNQENVSLIKLSQNYNNVMLEKMLHDLKIDSIIMKNRSYSEEILINAIFDYATFKKLDFNEIYKIYNNKVESLYCALKSFYKADNRKYHQLRDFELEKVASYVSSLGNEIYEYVKKHPNMLYEMTKVLRYVDMSNVFAEVKLKIELIDNK